MTEIWPGNSVKHIGYRAFSSCSELTAVFLPDSIESVDSGVFSACSLDSISISDSVAHLPSDVFEDLDLDAVHIRGPVIGPSLCIALVGLRPAASLYASGVPGGLICSNVAIVSENSRAIRATRGPPPTRKGTASLAPTLTPVASPTRLATPVHEAEPERLTVTEDEPINAKNLD